MINNASAGEYIFFSEPNPKEIDSREAHSFVSRRDIDVHPYKHVVFEEDLNSLARMKENVWTENDLMSYESRYMLENSQGRSFYKSSYGK